MSCRLSELCFDAQDPLAIAQWWAQVLSCEAKIEDGDAWIEPPDTVREIVFAPVPEGKTVKNRLHLDLRPCGSDQATEVARLKSLGAVEIDIGQGDHSWVVLADPEGNELCVLQRPFEEEYPGSSTTPVGARISDLVVDTRDAWALADWWAAVLEVEVNEKNEGDGMRWANLHPPDTMRRLLFLDVPEDKQVKNRLHIDVSPFGCDQETELARLTSLGAVEIDIGQGDVSWHVLADPEGNELCLLRGRFDEPSA